MCNQTPNPAVVTSSESNAVSNPDRKHANPQQKSIETLKPANRYLRWNLLLTFLVFVCLTFPFWLPLIPKINHYTLDIIVCLLVLIQLPWMCICANAAHRIYKMRAAMRKLQNTNVEAVATSSNIQHLIGVVMYKEPVELMSNTLQSLAAQPDSKTRMNVVVGLEEGTPDKELKRKELHAKFDHSFRLFLTTVHPKGVVGEIPGKCSNYGHAMRALIDNLRSNEQPKVDLSNAIVTTADCDSILPVGYFRLLEDDYHGLCDSQRCTSVWQSPLFYQMSLDKSAFFVRITGLLRSVLMMGALMPFSINTMSIFSVTLSLYEQGGGTHPGYQMDDIIALIRWMLHVGKSCQIRSIDLPTLSGPTSGSTYTEELYEWARQIRRWTIGAAEVFHYFMIKSGRLPTQTSIHWGTKFVGYYVVLLCICPLFSILAPSVTPKLLQLHTGLTHGWLIPSPFCFTVILLSLAALQYTWFLLVVLYNEYVNCCMLPQQHRDQTTVLCNIVHWVLFMPTVIGYCLVSVCALADISLRGKEVCTHKPTRKHALVVDEKNKAQTLKTPAAKADNTVIGIDIIQK